MQHHTDNELIMFQTMQLGRGMLIDTYPLSVMHCHKSITGLYLLVRHSMMPTFTLSGNAGLHTTTRERGQA